MRTHRIPIHAVVMTLLAAGAAVACSRDGGPAANESVMVTRGGAAGAAKGAVVGGFAAAPPAPHEGVAREMPTASPEPADVTDAPPGLTGAASDTVSVATTPDRSDAAAGAMLVRTGTASVQVDSLDPAIAKLRQIASRVGGVVADVSVQSGNNQNASASIELRMPSQRFDEAVNGLAPIGKVEAVNVSVEDVGEEFVDVTARVENAKRLEARLVELLATRTGKLGDVLQVERELARVREEIERYEGRLRYLRAHAAVSTLAVTVHEPLPVVGERGSGSVVAEAFRESWRNFVRFVAGFIASLGTLVPLALLVTVVAAAAVKGARRWRGQE